MYTSICSANELSTDTGLSVSQVNLLTNITYLLQALSSSSFGIAALLMLARDYQHRICSQVT